MSSIGYLLLCFNEFSAIRLEICTCSLSFIGIIITLMGIKIILWNIQSFLHKIIFKSNILLFFLTFIFSTIMFISRMKGIIYSKFKKSGILISIMLITFCAIGFIGNLVSNVSFIDNLITNKNILKLNDWIKSLLIIISLLIIWIILIMTTLSDNLRVNFEINGSYNDYLRAIDEENLASSQQKLTKKRTKRKKEKEMTVNKTEGNNNTTSNITNNNISGVIINNGQKIEKLVEEGNKIENNINNTKEIASSTVSMN